jgi:hypothetical protein
MLASLTCRERVLRQASDEGADWIVLDVYDMSLLLSAYAVRKRAHHNGRNAANVSTLVILLQYTVMRSWSTSAMRFQIRITLPSAPNLPRRFPITASRCTP